MKKITPLDIIMVIIILAILLVGFVTFKHYRQTAGKQIESTSPISFQVFLRGVTLTGGENPIVTGEKTFITIRNVPYTDLKVVDSHIETKKVSLPSSTKDFIIVDDQSQYMMYDIIVTLTDVAKITKDGPVVGGNKIKIGLPITLEGQTYKINGTVSNVEILDDNYKPVNASQNEAEALPQVEEPRPEPQKLPQE
ncbi:MAG: DUF4330 domain-containing protein [bacterium]|nr:DUF4330 domain-containing protein [bacterium]